LPFYDNTDDIELISLMQYLTEMNRQDDVRFFNRDSFEYELLEYFCDSYDYLVEKLTESLLPESTGGE